MPDSFRPGCFLILGLELLEKETPPPPPRLSEPPLPRPVLLPLDVLHSEGALKCRYISVEKRICAFERDSSFLENVKMLFQ